MQSIVQTGLINAAMATLLALAVFTLTRFWRAPPIVYALWLLVLARLVSPPLIELSILGYLHPYLPSPEVIGTAQMPGPSAGPIAPDRWGPGFSLDIERDGPSAGGGVGATGLTARQSDAWTTWIFLIWLTGSASSLLINGRRIVRFHRLIRFTPRAPGNLRARVSRIAGDLGLKRCPDVHLLDAPVCPMVWSLGSSPKLLLPVGLVARLDDEELSTLLAHELAHLRRRDHWVRWFEFFVRTLYWWNPVAWWAQRELHQAEEQCCDAWVLETFPEKSEAYGKALLKALCYASEIQPQLPSIASGIGATQSIRRRLKMIASMRTKRSLSALERSTLVLAAALALPFFPAFAQQADEQPEATVEPRLDAREIVAAFQATLASQRRFVFNFTDTGHVSHRAVSPESLNPQLEGDRTYYMAGELGSDGHRVAFRNKVWGQYNGVDRPPFDETDPQYIRDTYDGNEMWWYLRGPRIITNERNRAGSVGIQRGRSSEWIPSIVGHKSPTHWLQGYLSERGDRVDTLLRDATTLIAREARETAGTSVCDVVDFSSPYGRGTLWFDPARGYLIAQAKVYLGSGHLLPHGESLAEGYAIGFSLRDVSFERVGGVWFATGAEVETDIRTPSGRERRINHPRITNIRLNGDMDALGLFSKDDIEDGATVGYIGEQIRHVWRGGRIVPMNDGGR